MIVKTLESCLKFDGDELLKESCFTLTGRLVKCLVIAWLLNPILAFPVPQTTKDFCRRQSGFTREQTEFCFQNIELVHIFMEGFQLGHKECEKTFEDSGKTGTRWNCTNLTNRGRKNVFFEVAQAKDGSKEASVMTAFTAAGMLYNLIKKCQSGSLKKCKPSELYDCQSEGEGAKPCLEIDLEVPKRLLDEFFLVSLGSFKLQINKQNRNVAFKAIKELIYTDKKNRKQELLPLQRLNEHFLKLYKKAVRLKKKDLVNGRIPAIKLIKFRKDLIFVFREDKFNYCGKKDSWNWNGIGGRPCKFQTRDSYSIQNCVNMCCDFGYLKISETRKFCNINPLTNETICQVREFFYYYCNHGRGTRIKNEHS